MLFNAFRDQKRSVFLVGSLNMLDKPVFQEIHDFHGKHEFSRLEAIVEFHDFIHEFLVFKRMCNSLSIIILGKVRFLR